ncbi:DgyrCDS13757 [Dimorphilus gyrociliatus]|uniref:DgyrCDS13757 n=1 Tax=Dimorphilus gyrociliatus TaxID=2664684 RepID=A0A7I8WBR8_9ANNE|nr:DgyrCDS13757 [Dimorphilus gyrociliatus]
MASKMYSFFLCILPFVIEIQGAKYYEKITLDRNNCNLRHFDMAALKTEAIILKLNIKKGQFDCNFNITSLSSSGMIINSRQLNKEPVCDSSYGTGLLINNRLVCPGCKRWYKTFETDVGIAANIQIRSRKKLQLEMIITAFRPDSRCARYEFNCGYSLTGKCISDRYQCDRYNNCGDNRDESFRTAGCIFSWGPSLLRFTAIFFAAVFLFIIFVILIISQCCQKKSQRDEQTARNISVVNVETSPSQMIETQNEAKIVQPPAYYVLFPPKE